MNSQVGLKLIEFLCKYTHVTDEFGVWPAEAALPFSFFFFFKQYPVFLREVTIH